MYRKAFLITFYAVSAIVGAACFLLSLIPLFSFYFAPTCGHLFVTLADLGFTVCMVVLLKNSTRAAANNWRQLWLALVCLANVVVWNYLYVGLIRGTL